MSLIDTKIGTIAPDWKVVRLKDVAEKPQYGLTAKAAKSGDTQFLRITDITDKGVNWTTVPFCSAPKKKADTCRLKSGDIVFARIGATTGKSHMITNPPNAVFASYLIRVRAGEKLEPGFLIQFFQSHGYWQQVDANKHANLKKGVNGSILSELLLPLPPLPEQKKIAHILSTVQRAIQAQERIIQTTAELEKALMHKLFTEGLHNERQKQTEIGPIPASWEVVRFEEGVSIKNGQVDPKQEPFDEMLHVGSENIESDTGKLMKLQTNSDLNISSGNYHFTADDVLYSKIRPYLNKVALPEFEGTCSADMYPLRPNSHFTRKFLFYYLLSDSFKKTAISFQDRTGIPKINRAQLGSIQLACPSKEEQCEIAGALASCGSQRNVAQHKRETLQDLFRTLLHELMTARIRVHKLGILS